MILLCQTCRRHFPVTKMQIFDFIWNDLWPECCGQKMAHYVETDPPAKPSESISS